MREAMQSQAFAQAKPYLEIHAGRRTRKVSPGTMHAFVQGAMFAILRRCAAGRGNVGTEWDFDMTLQLGERTLLVPDVAFVRRIRLFGLSSRYLQIPAFAP